MSLEVWHLIEHRFQLETSFPGHCVAAATWKDHLPLGPPTNLFLIGTTMRDAAARFFYPGQLPPQSQSRPIRARLWNFSNQNVKDYTANPDEFLRLVIPRWGRDLRSAVPAVLRLEFQRTPDPLFDIVLYTTFCSYRSGAWDYSPS